MIRFNLKWLWCVALLFLMGCQNDNDKQIKQEEYSIQIENENYLCANKTQNYYITTDKKNASDWEIFTFYFLDSKHVKIRTFFGYIAVNKTGLLQVDKSLTFENAPVFKLQIIDEGLYYLSFLDRNINNSKGLLQVASIKQNNRLILKLKQHISPIKENNYQINIFYYQLLFISIVIFLMTTFIPSFYINTKYFYIIPGGLLVYILVRAFNIGFVIDEAWSYDILRNQPYYFRALIFDDFYNYAANNHVLNTVFGYISYFLFGNSPFSFRVFNILSFVVYAIYSIKIVRFYSNNNISILIGMVFMFLNPFMLEFFSLYRGYGLSLAFLSGLIYCFSKLYFVEYQQKLLIRGVLFSVLSVYSNFGLLFPVFVIQFLYFIHLNKYKNIKSIIISKAFLIFVIGTVLLIPAVSNILILSKQNELFFGGSTSFIKDSLSSMVAYTFFTTNVLDQLIIEGILIGLFFSAFFFTQNKKLFTIIVVILGIVFLSTVLNLFVESRFVIERASLYLIPFLAIFIMLVYDNPTQHKGFKTVFSILIIFITISSVKKGIKSYNLDSTTTWKKDVDIKYVLNDILNYNNNNDFTLALFWNFQQSIKYYAGYYGINKLKKISKLEYEPITIDSDFYYLTKSGLKNVLFEYIVVKEYVNSETILIKKKVNSSTVIVRFKAFNNKYIIANQHRGDTLIANSDNPWEWETFTLQMFENKNCALISSKEMYVSAELNGKGVLTATKKEKQSWETFTIEYLTNDIVAIKSYNGKYWSVAPETLQIVATADEIGEREKFRIQEID